jgi:serine/threonine protein kinase
MEEQEVKSPEPKEEDEEPQEGEIGKVVGKKYKLTKKLGSGAFGEIYLAINQETEEEYAMKLEPKKTRHSQLLAEAKLYQYFSKVITDPNPRTSNSYSLACHGSIITSRKGTTTS